MKTKYFAGLMGFVFLLAMGAGIILVSDVAQADPTISVTPAVATLDRNTKVVVMGSGFTQGKEILVMFEDKLGVPTALPVVGVPNKRGCWAVVWSLGRYARKKIVTEGVYTIMAADMNYNVLTSAPLAFVDATSDPKKWPAWAKAAKIKPQKKKKKKKK